MAFYYKQGQIPKKKHTTFYKDDGTLYREELVSTKGFSGVYTNKYHFDMPTKAKSYKEIDAIEDFKWENPPLAHFHFYTDKLVKDGDFLDSRIPYLHNDSTIVYTAKPNKNPDYFYKNAYNAEYIFVHHGTGELRSDYGIIKFVPGDQIIIPHGTIYQMFFDNFENNKLLIIESASAYEIPKHYRNEYGQLEEHAPYEERDFKLPELTNSHDEKGDFEIKIKAYNRMFEYIQPHHPFDLIGWDGFLYPFAFNIKDYNPKVGRIHLPPPVHLVFDTKHFVLCNFNPRYFDWHENSIPAPYYHSNIESAEMLYYVDGDFMSRKGVGPGSVTLHPMGIPHGPQPGKTEASIGTKWTDEYAVMLDTFEPLFPTKYVKECADENYPFSWLE